MKKILLFAGVAFLSLTSLQAQEFGFGVKAGANFASLNGDDVDNFDGRTSFHVGAVARIGITESFAVQPELVFSNQGYNYDFDGDDFNGRLGYINIPIMADYTLAEGFSLQGGPQIGINISADEEFKGNKEDIEDIETLDLGIGIGAQYRLPMNLFFQARYVIGLSEVIKDVDAKNSVISLSVGYFFM